MSFRRDTQVRGRRMTKRLGDSDRRADDLLHDRSMDAANGDGQGNGSYVSHAQPAAGPGNQSVQAVLSLLNLLPIDEPSTDLMARTLARIDSQSDVATQPMHPATAALMTDRPHA